MLSRVLEAELYAVAPHDPATTALAVLALGLAAAVAAAAPARRATRVDPVHALRYE